MDGLQYAAFAAAAAVGRAEILKALLEVNPPAATASTALGATLLHLAAYFRQGDAVAVLLRAGADVNALYQGATRCPNQPLTTALEKSKED